MNHIAERQRANLFWIDPRPLHRFADYLSREFRRGDILQRAAIVADGCAHAAEYYDFTFRHDASP